MATGSLGEVMWRMLRRVDLHDNAPQPVHFNDIRSMARADVRMVRTLTVLGLLRETTEGSQMYALTPAGREACRFGEIEAEVLTAAHAKVRDEIKDQLRKKRKAMSRLRSA